MPKINPRISSLDDLLGVAREVENTAAAEDKPAQPGEDDPEEAGAAAGDHPWFPGASFPAV